MKCGVCGTPLVRVGYRPKQYRDWQGRIYKTIHWPKYAPCSRLDDPEAHPARHRGKSKENSQDEEANHPAG